jgi:diadenosine tetraphosphatase ApaH/serine/threonine PP2A family protein phosphatase
VRHPNHDGKATWGERIVPLEDFRAAARNHGRALGPTQREQALERYLRAAEDPTPVEGPFRRIAVFGGVYSNQLALEALLHEVGRHDVDALYCLGDLGGFGPHPDGIRPWLERGKILTIQGNYEQALGGGAEDCNCGYVDPRDNHFAALSYDYTAKNTSAEFKRWMGRLPTHRRVRLGRRELLLVHGSPRRINEFLFESTSSVPFLERLLAHNRCDGLICTHTGLHWHRRLPSGGDVVNVGAIGRPANDGAPHVWYAVLQEDGSQLEVRLLPLAYDHQRLAHEMRSEKLPDEFVETILSGWWTTCLEILPARERAASRY